MDARGRKYSSGLFLLFRCDSRKSSQSHCQFFLRIALISELAREIVGIGLHVEMAVTAQIEQDGASSPRLLAFERFVDGAAHRVGGFGGRHDALGAGELAAALVQRDGVGGAALDAKQSGHGSVLEQPGGCNLDLGGDLGRDGAGFHSAVPGD